MPVNINRAPTVCSALWIEAVSLDRPLERIEIAEETVRQGQLPLYFRHDGAMRAEHFTDIL